MDILLAMAVTGLMTALLSNFTIPRYALSYLYGIAVFILLIIGTK